jgi:hypothetical protein
MKGVWVVTHPMTGASIERKSSGMGQSGARAREKSA